MNREELPQLDYQKPIVNIVLKEEKIEAFPLIGNKRMIIASHHSSFKLCWKFWLIQIRQEKERYTDWEGRNQTAFVIRLHNCQYRKSKKIDKNSWN